MFDTIKKWNEDRKLDKEMKRMMRNQFYDYLVAKTESKNAETKAYESMTMFGTNFKPEDLQKVIGDLDKIASNPKLTEKYYSQISKQAHEQKMKELDKVK